MAGIGVLALRGYQNMRYLNRPGHFSDYNPEKSNSRPNSANSNYSIASFRSKESSIDIAPDESLCKLLKAKKDFVTILYSKQKYADVFTCILGISGLFLSLTLLEVNEARSGLINGLCIGISISTCMFLIGIGYSAYLDFGIIREKKLGVKEGCDDIYWTSPQCMHMILEILLFSFHPLPFINPKFEFSQLNGVLLLSLHDIFTSFTLLRVFQLLKLFRHFSKWTNEQSSAICDSYAANANISYALRALLREKPIQLILIFFSVSTIVLSLALRIYEKNFMSLSGEQNYAYLWNSMWLILLTMTTVGFGDFYPNTHIGRFIITIAANWGIFIVSLMILALTNTLQLTSAQARSHTFMKKLQLKQKSNRCAGVYLNSIIELFIFNRKKQYQDLDFQEKKSTMLIKAKAFFRKFKYFRSLSQKIEKSPEELLRVINEVLGYEINRLEEIIRTAKDFEEQLKILKESQNKSIEYLAESKCLMKKLLSELVSIQDIS